VSNKRELLEDIFRYAEELRERYDELDGLTMTLLDYLQDLEALETSPTNCVGFPSYPCAELYDCGARPECAAQCAHRPQRQCVKTACGYVVVIEYANA
jgi:hypothetical protein